MTFTLAQCTPPNGRLFCSTFLPTLEKPSIEPEQRGKILLRAGQENGRVFLEFADNGDGTAPANEDRYL